MKRKREKGYWVKRREEYSDGSDARSRARTLRLSEHVQHVQVGKQGGEYILSYSVAKWYLEELEKSGLSL